jgi:hypothetical protein
LHDIIADDEDIYDHLKTSEWAQQLLRSHGGGTDISQELQKRGFECLQGAASVETGERVSNAFFFFSGKLQVDAMAN